MYCEGGYFSFFGVPTELITVDISTLLVIGSTIVCFLTILFPFGDMLIGMTPEKLLRLKGKVRPFIILLLGFLAMWLVFAYFLNFRWRKAIVVPAWVTLSLLIQHLSAYYCKNRAITDKVFTLFVIAITGVVLFRAIGKWNAESQRSFAVLPDKPGSFVIQKMGDSLLLGKHDEKSKTTFKTFQILPFSGQSIAIEKRDI